MANESELIVNDVRHVVKADAQTPLLYILRNDLGLRGTKFGCGEGDCGSCTVIVDGVAEQSCQLPLSAVAGRHVTTIEGLGRETSLHPLQEAFIEYQAAQCGYCISGVILAAVPIL